VNRHAAIFFLLYAGAVIYLSLYPFQFLPYSRSFMLFWVADSNRVFLDTVLNVLFYIPLGAAALMALGRSVPAWIASVLVGTFLSLAMEMAQLYLPMRYGNLRDWTANSFGTVLGAAGAYALSHPRIAERLSPLLDTARWRISSVGVLFLSLWALWQAFPFVPDESPHRFAQALRELVRPEWSWISASAAGRSFFGFYVLAVAVGRRSRWLLLAFLLLPAQTFLLDRAATLLVIVGAFAGWAASGIQTPRLSATVLAMWLAVEEFRPFHFTAAPQTFSWAPFQAWFGSAAETTYPIYFSKTFLYTSVAWALLRCGLGWSVSVLIPAAILASGEWTQRFLEGRTPEITDLLLLAAGASLLKLCEPRS